MRARRGRRSPSLEAEWFQRGLRVLTRAHSSLAGGDRASLRSRIVQAGKDLNAMLDEIVAGFGAAHEQRLTRNGSLPRRRP